MGQPITTNPALIAVINMTVVFVVLYGLSLMIRLITLIDPTQKKKTVQIEIAKSLQQNAAAADILGTEQEEYDEMIILFTAALAAYGHSDAKILAIRPVSRSAWSLAARMQGVNHRG